MAGDDDAQAEALRRFHAVISGLELADLRQPFDDPTLTGGLAVLSSVRPELRRPAFDALAILRVRVDLDGAEPPIWRLLDLRCDLTLDVVHQVLQVAFDWTDSHLHRFALVAIRSPARASPSCAPSTSRRARASSTTKAASRPPTYASTRHSRSRVTSWRTSTTTATTGT